MTPDAFTWKELIAVCGSAQRARRLLKEGRYRRELRNAYVLNDDALPVMARAAALQKALPQGVALSHWAALWALGLDVLPRDARGNDVLDLTVDRERRVEGRVGVRTHCARITDDDLVMVNGVLLVSAARAVVDVARSFGLIEGVACADAALRAGVTDLPRIEAVLARSGGLRHVVRARSVLDHVEPRSESLMESRLRLGFVLAGGPRMHAQVDFYDEVGSHRGRGDLYLDGVLVEFDGREQRLQQAKFTHDRRRGNNVADLAIEVRRFSGADLFTVSPHVRLQTLLNALELARHRTRPRLRSGPDTLRAPVRKPLPTIADQRMPRAA